MGATGTSGATAGATTVFGKRITRSKKLVPNFQLEIVLLLLKH